MRYAPRMESEAGVRFELRCQALQTDSVRYAVTLDLVDQRFTGQAELGTSTGQISFVWEESAAAPPDWCVTAVRAQLRTVFRERSAGKVFPRRITRWRPAPTRAPE